MITRLSWAERAYRATLLIFPPAFRARFSDEMIDFARERSRIARSQSTVALTTFAIGTFIDLVRSAPGAWLALMRDNDSDAALPNQPRDNVDILRQDVRFAVRSLLKRPGFTIVAALTLALGIGANVAIFSVVDAVLIRPLPFPHADRLVVVNGVQGSQGGQGVSYADYVDWRRLNRTFAELGTLRGQSVNLTGGDAPDRLFGAFVSASFLRVMHASMSQGRTFTDAETEIATATPIAIVSDEAWRSRFGADPSQIGKTLVLNGTAFTVVGIMAPKQAIAYNSVPDVMVPIAYYPNANGLVRGTRGVSVVGRLKQGTSIDAARRDLSAIETQLASDFPVTNAGTGAEVVSLRDTIVGPSRGQLAILLGAVGVVLLIACANVANLQLARGASRVRELSVRAALGAGRRRIAQQILTESIVLSLVGGIASIALAGGLTKGIVALIGSQLPVDPATIGLDAPVLAFALAISIVTGILFGLPPALKASRADLADMLRSRLGVGHSHRVTRNALVVVQLALSLALLAAAGLLTRSLIALQQVNPGFDGGHLLTAQFRLPAAKYDSPEKIATMFDRTIAELRAIPGVKAAALVRASPLSGNGETYPVSIEGRPTAAAGDAPQLQLNSVTPGYFDAMKITLVRGRDFTSSDRLGALPVVVVNRAFALASWPGESPIGKRIRVSDSTWRTIVGVAGDTRHFSLNEKQLLQAYVPHAQRPQIFTSVVVRATGDPLLLAKPVREAIWRVDRDQPVWRFRSMEDDLVGSVASSKTTMWLTGLFALVALLVASVGIYGVLSYTMAQRTQEVGIRIALGADPRRVTGMVIRDGIRVIGVAVIAGLLASLASAELLRSSLYGVGPYDIVTFAVVTVVLLAVSLAACYLPARRASRLDPLVALRND
jgi:putative ABC transport system permease protein